jgi:phosphoribosylanthranilate isomerase
MSLTPTQVKVCGLTRLEDAELAVELGAWALGMVFFEPSPRRCSLEQAQLIAASLRRKAELCGVFVNAPMEEILRVSEELGLTLLQLHGDEGPAFCGEAARRTGARVIKAMQVSGPGDVQDVARYHTDFHLLDARSRTPGRELLRGGTGETFDWGLLEGRRSKTPLILSGGLAPENVAEGIEAVRPFAVDTASGTESAPGRKDLGKLVEFFATVERVSASPEPVDVSPAPVDASPEPMEAPPEPVDTPPGPELVDTPAEGELADTPPERVSAPPVESAA